MPICYWSRVRGAEPASGSASRCNDRSGTGLLACRSDMPNAVTKRQARRPVPHGLVLVAFLPLAACGRYSDFTLPPMTGGDPAAGFAFVALPDPILARGDF